MKELVKRKRRRKVNNKLESEQKREKGDGTQLKKENYIYIYCYEDLVVGIESKYCFKKRVHDIKNDLNPKTI